MPNEHAIRRAVEAAIRDHLKSDGWRVDSTIAYREIKNDNYEVVGIVELDIAAMALDLVRDLSINLNS